MHAGVTEDKAALRLEMAELVISDWQSMLEAFLALPEVAAARTILLFYGVGEPVWLWLMVATILADYGFGLWIEHRAASGRDPKSVLTVAVLPGEEI